MLRHQPKQHATDVIGLPEVYSFLKRFKLIDSLINVAHVNAVLKWGNEKKYVKQIPPSTVDWVVWYRRKYPHDRFLTLTMSRLARYLILAGGNDHRELVLTPGEDSFNTAINLVNGISELEEGEDFKTELGSSRIFGRIFASQFPLQFHEIDLIGHAYLLFIEIANLSTEYNFAEKFKEYFNITPFEFLAAGFAIWALSDGTFGDQPFFEPSDLSKTLTTEKMRTALFLCSGTVMDYRIALRGADWKSINKRIDCFGLDPFFSTPAIATDRKSSGGENIFIIPSPKHLLIRASSGVFYLLADKERESNSPGSKRNAFRVAFGDLYRKYVERMIAAVPEGTLFIDLDTNFEYANAKKPDFAIITGKVCLLIEVKTSILTIDARLYFEESKLREEVGKGGMNTALDQLQKFISKWRVGQIVDRRFKGVERIVPLILGYEDIFVLNSTLLPIINEKSSELIRDLQLGTITDVDAIGSALAQGHNICELIEKKATSDTFRSWSIGQYLIDEGVNRDAHLSVRNAFEEFTRLVLSQRDVI